MTDNTPASAPDAPSQTQPVPNNSTPPSLSVRRRLALGALGCLALLTLVFVISYKYSLSQPLPGLEQTRTVLVEEGQTFRQVLTRLQDDGILGSVWLSRIYLRLNNLHTSLKVGEFELPAGSTLPEVIAILGSNRRIEYRLTLPEGTTFKEWRRLLAAAPVLKQETEGMDDQAVYQKVRSEAAWLSDSPEGMFYPDTYFYHRGDSDLSLLKRAHLLQVELVESLWPSRRENLPLKTPYEALILASIIERETGHPSERGQIGGVFVRRLELGMRLQTDPTVIYGLGERYQGNLTRKHLQEENPFNTYRIFGLPPTPIAMPGRAAIEAALNPEPGETLFFVAKGDGSHQFSVTLEEHEKAVREFQLKRREDYRSQYRAPKPAADGAATEVPASQSNKESTP